VTAVVDAMGNARIVAGDGIGIRGAISGCAPTEVVIGRCATMRPAAVTRRGAADRPAALNTAMTAHAAVTAARTIGRMGRADAKQRAVVRPAGQDRKGRCKSGRQGEAPHKSLAAGRHYSEPRVVGSDRRSGLHHPSRQGLCPSGRRRPKLV